MQHPKRLGFFRTGVVALVVGAFGASPAVAKGRDVTSPAAATQLRIKNLPSPIKGLTVVRDWRAEGDRLLAKGDNAGALNAFEKALRSNADDLDLRRLVGDLHYTLGHPVEAVRHWVKALELAPRHPELLDRVARGATEVGDFELAAQAEGRLVDVIGDLVEANDDPKIDAQYRRHLILQAELSALAGDFTAGAKAARRLIRHAPRHIDGRLALAYVHLQAAEYDDAEGLYHEVLAVAPHNTTAMNNLGNIEYMRRDFDQAAERFERILGIEGVRAYSESIALANLGELLQIQGAFGDAEYLYKQAIDVRAEGAWGYMGLASLLDQTGRHDQATEAMIEGWERDQNHLTRLNMHFYTEEWAWQRDAMIAEIEGDLDLARALWMRILRGDVTALHKSAAHHLRSLDQLQD